MLACIGVGVGLHWGRTYSLSICCMACLINVAISESLATRLDKRCTGPVALEYSVSTRSLNSRKLPPQWILKGRAIVTETPHFRCARVKSIISRYDPNCTRPQLHVTVPAHSNFRTLCRLQICATTMGRALNTYAAWFPLLWPRDCFSGRISSGFGASRVVLIITGKNS